MAVYDTAILYDDDNKKLFVYDYGPDNSEVVETYDKWMDLKDENGVMSVDNGDSDYLYDIIEDCLLAKKIVSDYAEKYNEAENDEPGEYKLFYSLSSDDNVVFIALLDANKDYGADGEVTFTLLNEWDDSNKKIYYRGKYSKIDFVRNIMIEKFESSLDFASI